MFFNCGVGEDSWESSGQQGDPTSPSKWKSVLNIHWKDWCWRWSSNTLATWCEELTHLKRNLMLGKTEGRRRRGQQRMRWLNGITISMDMSLVNSGSWWWTGRPGVLRFMGSQRVGHDWATKLKLRKADPWSHMLEVLDHFQLSFLSLINITMQGILKFSQGWKEITQESGMF